MSVNQRIALLDSRVRKLQSLAVAFGILEAMTLVGVAWLLSQTVARVFLAHERLESVVPLLSAMLILVVLRSGLIWSREMVSQHTASRVKEALRAQLTHRLFARGPVRISGERSGELVNTLSQGIEALDEYVTQYQPARTLASIVPALLVLVVFAVDPWTALALVFAGPLLVLALALIGARTRELSARRFRELSWMSAHFLDVVQGLATLKMFGRSKEQAEVIDEISQRFATTTMDVLRTAFQMSLMLEWAAVATTAFVALEVSLRLMHGLLPFSVALLVLLLTPDVFLPLRQLALKYHAGTAGAAAAERIWALLDAPVVPTPPPPPPTPTPPATLSQTLPASAPPIRHATTGAADVSDLLAGDIEFADVRFTYDDAERAALQGLSFRIPHGQTVALVGPTGAGKTTVASLLLRFIEPTAGHIAVGSTPLSGIDPGSWRALVGWMPQRPHLFAGTIADNIRLARPDATMEEIEAAAQAAHVDAFVRALPRGYETPIHEGGARLSGGQRQRIAIARALLKDAPILILDEATAHLDAESEALIQDAIHCLLRGRTTLIIAHRLTMAYSADTIIVMDQGRAVECGDHRALLAKGGLYQTLVATYEEAAKWSCLPA